MDKFPAEFAEQEQKSQFALDVEKQLESLLKIAARQEIYALHDNPDSPGVISKSEGFNLDREVDDRVAMHLGDIAASPVFKEIIKLTEKGNDDLDGVDRELAMFIVQKHLNPEVYVDAA